MRNHFEPPGSRGEVSLATLIEHIAAVRSEPYLVKSKNSAFSCYDNEFDPLSVLSAAVGKVQTFLKYFLLGLFMCFTMVPAFSQQMTTAAPTAATALPSGSFDAPATSAPKLPTTAIVLAGGTTVEVSVSEPISSNTAKLDDIVPIIVDKEVDADGFVVIPKASNGAATVALVDAAGGNGHGGKLGLTMNWVYSADHGKVLLSDVNHSAGAGSDQKGAASTATILSYVLLGPLGLFAHNFVRGKDVTVETTQRFNVFVDHDVHVSAFQKAQIASGFDN
jgi:hypothetical protein